MTTKADNNNPAGIGNHILNPIPRLHYMSLRRFWYHILYTASIPVSNPVVILTTTGDYYSHSDLSQCTSLIPEGHWCTLHVGLLLVGHGKTSIDSRDHFPASDVQLIIIGKLKLIEANPYRSGYLHI